MSLTQTLPADEHLVLADHRGQTEHPVEWRRGAVVHALPRPRRVGGLAGGPLELGPDAERNSSVVYRYAVDMGEFGCVVSAASTLGLTEEALHDAVTLLVHNRMLRHDSDTGRLLPVDPEVAAALLVTPMEREIHQRQELIAQIRQRATGFREDYARRGREAQDAAALAQVEGTVELQGHLRLAGDSCRSELMVLLSGQPDDGALDDVPQLCAQLAERGVAVRIVCQHRSRADLRLRAGMRQLFEAGAEVRTVTHVPRAALVFDRSLALLLGEDDGAAVRASRIGSDAVIGFLLDMFGHLWDIATPLESLDSGYSEVAGDLRQTIAGLMAKGFTDEVLARKLGMSVRTCRRHIASLMRELDSVSRFQAGVQAAHRSLVVTA